MKKLKIDRRKWTRGKHDNHINPGIFHIASFPDDKATYLHCGKTGNMCCLGFYLEQVRKIAKNKFTNAEEPSDVDGVAFQTWYNDAIYINDRNIPESDREAMLISLFAKQGIDVEFVN